MIHEILSTHNGQRCSAMKGEATCACRKIGKGPEFVVSKDVPGYYGLT